MVEQLFSVVAAAIQDCGSGVPFQLCFYWLGVKQTNAAGD